jgi:hypothetical protein
MGITVEQVEAIAAKLRALPPADNKSRVVSKQESIKMLTGEIAELRERGYTLEQIAELLTSEKLDIGAPTLKSYLQRSKPSGKKASSKRKSAAPTAPPRSTPSASVVSANSIPQQSLGEKAAAALPQTTGSSTNTVAAITRPDRQRI